MLHIEAAKAHGVKLGGPNNAETRKIAMASTKAIAVDH
jgi:hypothetical protein